MAASSRCWAFRWSWPGGYAGGLWHRRAGGFGHLLLLCQAFGTLPQPWRHRGFPGPGFQGQLPHRLGNVLMWLSYVVMLALYSHASALRSHLFSGGEPGTDQTPAHFLAIVAPALLNVASAKIIGRTEIYVVAIKIIILLFFLAMGLGGVEPAAWPRTNGCPCSPWWPEHDHLRGLRGIRANRQCRGDIREPSRDLPRAYTPR